MVKKGICKIIDLGLSKQVESESCILGTNVGSEYTKAPEIKHHKPYGLKVYLTLLRQTFFPWELYT
jgi:serine/threonine protein kinase